MRVLSLVALSLLSLNAMAEKVVLGKLGQTLERTPIYQLPSTKSRVYYRAKAYEYIVVNSSPNPKYLKVLMSNGAQGYVASTSVARLPYDAVIDQTRDSSQSWRGSMSKGTSSGRAAIANYSLKFTGTPYKWGGNDPVNGIDCSGFVKFLYGQIGVSLPRTAAEQVKVGVPITRYEDLQPGDRLYFWSTSRNKVGHTGIYLGNGYFSHSSTTNGGVATDNLGNPHWQKMLVAARR